MFFKDQVTKGFLKIGFWFILIALFIAGAFHFNEYGNQLKIDDYFNFVGSFGGAIFGGLISILILKITFEKQKEQFDAERRKDVFLSANEDMTSLYRENYNMCKELMMRTNSLTFRLGRIQKRILEYDVKYQFKKSDRDEAIEIYEEALGDLRILVSDISFKCSLIADDVEEFNKIDQFFSKVFILYNEFKKKNPVLSDYNDLIIKISKAEELIDSYISHIVDETYKLRKSKFEMIGIKK